MQFQSDIADVSVKVSIQEELSAVGVAYMAGITMGLYDKSKVFSNLNYETYIPVIEAVKREQKICKVEKSSRFGTRMYEVNILHILSTLGRKINNIRKVRRYKNEAV